VTKPQTLLEASCADDYDPNSMPVARARELIRRFLDPVTAIERVHVRQALGRVLAEDVVSPVDVPGHDNSAMDGWAVRFADLAPDAETRLARIGESFAGKPFVGTLGPGQAVRIFTGAVMPVGADSVVMQERAREVEGGVAIAPGAVTQAGQNRRAASSEPLARMHSPMRSLLGWIRGRLLPALVTAAGVALLAAGLLTYQDAPQAATLTPAATVAPSERPAPTLLPKGFPANDSPIRKRRVSVPGARSAGASTGNSSTVSRS